MAGSKAIWFFVVLSISMLLSWTNPRGETLKSFYPLPLYYSNSSTQSASSSNDDISSLNNVSTALLRLSFHDCFVEGCNASRQAIPNQTLRGFDKIDSVKEEFEKACPGVVSCADIVSIATRDGIMLAGGPFYPVLTGRRDSIHSYFNEALAAIPRPDDNIKQTLHLFDLKSLKRFKKFFGAHNIGKIGYEFIQKRLSEFKGTGLPDPTIAPDFLPEMRMRCQDSNGTTTRPSSSSMASLGLLFADQQLMANEKTARLERAYASDDGSTFRMDFARAMMKMLGLDLLTGSQGQVWRNCFLPLVSS
ncbi:hypothetical protein ACB092_11G043300 [Castanea dentata]